MDNKIITGTTQSGFAFSISAEVLDDMELLDTIASIDENPLALSKALKRLLGKEQHKALYDHLRNEQGRVPVLAVSEAIVDIFTNSGTQGKN